MALLGVIEKALSSCVQRQRQRSAKSLLDIGGAQGGQAQAR